jgi:enoyl-CoA hydratase
MTGVRTITLSRPEKANALSAELVESLLSQATQAQTDGVRVLVIRSEGRNFSAGFDFAGYQEQSQEQLVERFVRIETLLQAVASSPCLTVGLAHGKNFGAGVDLFAACKWRIAAPGTTFRMPGLAFGLVLGTRRFAAIVGRERARSLLEGLVTFSAEEALQMGFIREIAPPESWPAIIEAAAATAEKLGPGREALYRTLAYDTGREDMEDLVRSASVPGLKDRIARYLSV